MELSQPWPIRDEAAALQYYLNCRFVLATLYQSTTCFTQHAGSSRRQPPCTGLHGLSLQRIQYISRQCISVFNVFIKNSLQRRLLLSSLFMEEKHSKSHLSGNVEGRYKRAQSSQVWAHYIENGMLKHRKN